PKGFIAVDGSSLTIGTLHKLQRSFEVYLIPETLRVSNFSNRNVGSYVNLEPDIKTMILVETIRDHFSINEARIENLEKELAALKKFKESILKLS
ncbi:MAG: hypothetical protein REH83_03065, partial [Rickettsiella sp.]|nr:hypothetical protein [Rickettsiella sp.]